MSKKANFRFIIYAIISLADEAIILVALLLVLSWLGIDMPLWLIILLSVVLMLFTFVVYRTFKKEPLIGFENMVGKHGVTVGPLLPKGTVKIANELWSAESDAGEIKNGKDIIDAFSGLV